MSEDLKRFIDVCLANTKELSGAFEKNGEIMVKINVDFTHRYILEVAKQFGYVVE